MDRVRLLRKAAGWINYLGSGSDFSRDFKNAVKGDSEEAIDNFENKVESGDLPDKLNELLRKKRSYLKRKVAAGFLLGLPRRLFNP